MDARQTLKTACEQVLRAVDARALTRDALSGMGRHIGSTAIIGAGKAAVAMTLGAADALGAISGVIVTKDESADVGIPGVRILRASHPLPDGRSVAAARELLAAAAGRRVLALWSGGASALAALPAEGIELADKIAATRALAAAGASIGELNCVRKHLSASKGGRLGAATAGGVALHLSDVLGDDPSTIGGGPFVGDPTTYGDALEVIARLAVEVPPAVAAHLAAGAAGQRPETPKPGDPSLAGIDVRVIGGNDLLVDAAAAALEAAGVHVVARVRRVADTVEELAIRLATAAAHLAAAAAASGTPLAYVAGGEPTIRLPAHPGRGGRAQHTALLLARALAERPPVGGVDLAALCVASDGSDGPTTDAGGLVDAGTWARAGDAAGSLARYDAGPALAAAGDLITTGPTGTNVNDLYAIVAVA